MKEKFLVISYFDMKIGPNTLYTRSDISTIYGFPDLSKILDFSNKDGTFLFSFRKFQTINTVFNMRSDIARGGTDLLMISCIVRASYFKNELTDIFKYLESKKVYLDKFASELKALPNFNSILYKYKQNPSVAQFTRYCKEENVNFFSVYDRYHDLIFPESEIKLITQDINLKKKIFLIGPKGSGKDTYLRNIETLQFFSENNLDIPTRIMGIMLDNIVASDAIDFFKGKTRLDKAQAVIFIVKDTDGKTSIVVKSFIEKFMSSYSGQLFGKIPLLIINNEVEGMGKAPLREEEIKEIFRKQEFNEQEIPFKYYSLNVIKEDPLLLEPLKWIIKEIFT
ncbi:MAG: hypothetical protein JW891_04710 [Candidatus Lokiarchaeota archaeon]|nr:hypothetical protein [Candidatus Lokiarchaeota archaeon]